MRHIRSPSHLESGQFYLGKTGHSYIATTQGPEMALMDRPHASTVQLVDALYGDRDDGGPEYASRCVYVWICFLRRKLAPPWGIKSVKRRFGYELRWLPER